jgi:glyoxylase-like metal-dependent hydrolase (beta-lactamase superfamily II)/rhodanese-related sulfurtransferase
MNDEVVRLSRRRGATDVPATTLGVVRDSERKILPLSASSGSTFKAPPTVLPTMSAAEITPEEVAARRREGEDPFLFDVRRTDDYEEWHVGGTDYHADLYDELLEGRYDGLDDVMDDLPAGEEIVTVCVAGVTSARAAGYLNEHGYDARSMEDGMRGWGRVYEAYDTEVAGLTQFVRPGTGCVSYVLADAGTALLVDPGIHVDRYREFADEADLDIVGAVDTHAHADHISGGPRVADEFDVRYFLHEADSGALQDYEPLADGDAFQLGDRRVRVVHTPGHTPGSVTLRVGDALLSGDTLFLRSVGRPDLEDDDEDAVRAAAAELHDSLDRLRELPEDTVVLPGHFSEESERPLETTLGELRADNELFATEDREAFVDEVVAGLSDTPANYERIKRINWGQEAPDDAADLELGPNNCAAN